MANAKIKAKNKYSINIEFNFVGESVFTVEADTKQDAEKIMKDFLIEKLPKTFFGVQIDKIRVGAQEITEGKKEVVNEKRIIC